MGTTVYIYVHVYMCVCVSVSVCIKFLVIISNDVTEKMKTDLLIIIYINLCI